MISDDYVTASAISKSPLPYWLNAASHVLFAFPSLPCAFPTSLQHWHFFWLCSGSVAIWPETKAGFFAAIVLATSSSYIYTRFLFRDIMFACADTDSSLFVRNVRGYPSPLLCWMLGRHRAQRAHKRPNWNRVSCSHLCRYLFLVGSSTLLKLRPFFVVLIFLAIAAPWHVLASLRNPAQGNAKGFFWFYFINEQINRYSTPKSRVITTKSRYLSFGVWFSSGLLPGRHSSCKAPSRAALCSGHGRFLGTAKKESRCF